MTICQKCKRDIKVFVFKKKAGNTPGTFYPHKDKTGEWCEGSYTPKNEVDEKEKTK